jgi:DNA topoisomerase-1
VTIRRVDVASPGFGRRRAGRGFTYRDCDGERITDADIIARIRSLAIPPAWKDVWICPDPCGHIQAMGIDDRGRRQYRYHDDWRDRRDRAKHDRMLEIARALPRLRRRLQQDLAAEGLGRDRVLACAVRLLELGLFRVGGEAYADDNRSYGLATLRRGHVRAHGDELRFDYPGKSAQRRVVTIGDPEVVEVVRALKHRRRGGPELLAYKHDRGRWVDVRSTDINSYLHDTLGPDVTAKDFRTWTATVLAAVGLAVEEDVGSERQRRSAVIRVLGSVAQQLGNTPAVARSSYVDPRVIERFEDGQTLGSSLPATEIEGMAGDLGLRPADAAGGISTDDADRIAVDGVPTDLLAEIDRAVVDLIEGSPRRRARARRG